jgi:allophanate hydrolase
MTTTQIVVVGAHLAGQPLNYQLTDLGARLNRAVKTAPLYKLYALLDGPLPKPALIRVGEEEGAAFEVESWDMPVANLGKFLLQVPSPLALGTVFLEDGTRELGFLCEPLGVVGALDISHLTSWRTYLATR